MNETEISVPDRGSIDMTCYQLRLKDNLSCQIIVNSHEKDDITHDIVNHTYSFPPPFNLLPAMTSPNQRVLDLGAHIGTFSLFAAIQGYEVAAVEASPHNAFLLQESIRLNSLANIQVIPVAVSDRAETISFIQAGPYGIVANSQLNDPTISVQAKSVDEILADLGWDRVDFIKMDIEGSEVKAIAGMSKLLSREDAPIILFESNGHTLNYFGETPNRLMAALKSFGYRCYLIEGERLIPLQADELLFGCVVDCLASKAPITNLQDWPIREPLSREEKISHIASMATSPHPHPRAYIARILQGTEHRLLTDPRVFQSLESLAIDPDPDVRTSAVWFQAYKSSLSLSKFIARLANYFSHATRGFRRRTTE